MLLLKSNNFYYLIYLFYFIVFSFGKENIPPILTTPRHSIDLSNEQIYQVY